MIRAFFLVVIDLWRFVVGTPIVPGVRTEHQTPYRLLSSLVEEVVLPLPAKVPQELLGEVSPEAKAIVRGNDVLIPSHISPLTLPESTSSAQPSSDASTVDDAELVLEEASTWVALGDRLPPLPIFSTQVFYIVPSDGTPLLCTPQLDFDGATAHLLYGQSVTVRAYVGAYAEVTSSFGAGYVHKDALSPNYHAVWPQYKNGECYECDAQATIATRRLLDDTFLAGRLSLPLQAGEYILVRLLRDHHTIDWPEVRPRLAGAWHHILRGVPGVRSGIQPLTDTIMEWQAEDGTGRLAYVEGVLPDGTLHISAVGLVVAGEYSELTFKSEVWREWRPVFISVTS
jgi:hypothetical protein